MNQLAPLLIVAGLVACTPQTQLKDLGDAQLTITFSESKLAVCILPPAKPSADDENRKAGCSKLSMSITASFNGMPLERLTGIYAFGDLTYDRACIVELAFPGERASDRGGPEVELAGPIPIAARKSALGLLRIEDRSAKWTLSVPDAFTHRTLTLESPPGSGEPTLRRGERAVLRWSPTSDVLQGKDMRLRLQPPARRFEGMTIGSDRLTIEGDRLSFTVPSDVPERLNGAIELEVLEPSRFEPKLLGCPVKKCDVQISPTVDPVRATLLSR